MLISGGLGLVVLGGFAARICLLGLDFCGLV